MECRFWLYSKSPKGSRNRIHSEAHSSATLVGNEKKVGKGTMVDASQNMTIGNPISGLHSGPLGRMSPGTTILASTLDREAQRERDNYTATVRSEFFYRQGIY